MIDYTRINWKNEPNETTPLSAENLNKMDKAIDDLATDVNSLEPNPVDVATEGLEKLAYGGTVYEVKGGHKIVDDSGTTLAQKDNMKFGGVYSHNSGTITVVDTVREFNSVSDIEALTGEEAKGFQYLDDNVYDAFTAGDIGFDNSDTSFIGTDVQEVLEEVDTSLKAKADKDKITNISITNNQGGTETHKATLYVSGNIGILDFVYSCQNATSETITFGLPTGWNIQRGGIIIRDNNNGNLITGFCNPAKDFSTYNHIGTMTVGHMMYGSAMCYKTT